MTSRVASRSPAPRRRPAGTRPIVRSTAQNPCRFLSSWGLAVVECVGRGTARRRAGSPAPVPARGQLDQLSDCAATLRVQRSAGVRPEVADSVAGASEKLISCPTAGTGPREPARRLAVPDPSNRTASPQLDEELHGILPPFERHDRRVPAGLRRGPDFGDATRDVIPEAEGCTRDSTRCSII